MTDPIKAEPVAWMYERGSERKAYTERSQAALVCSYTETPLYTHAQLVEARRLAWNAAIEAAANDMASWFPPGTEGHRNYGAIASVHALTKDSTHD